MTIRVLNLIGGGEVGGAEENVLNLLQNFNKERVIGYLGCLIKGSPFALLAKSNGISADIFPMRFPLDIFPVIPIIKFCRANNISLIHCHGARANLVGRIAARILSIPAVSTIHSHPASDYTDGLRGKIALLIDNITLPLASGFITVSNDLKDFIKGRLNKKGLTLPIRTIYNGCKELDFSDKDRLRSEFRSLHAIPNDFIVIGTIGRLHPVKDQSSLIEAMKLLVKEFPNIHLLIIGEGSLHSHLLTLLSSSQLSYTLTGYLPSAWQALPAMDLFVLPSLNEGMGIVLLEAAQAEIPIVASEVGGIPELLTNGEDSLLVRPAQPIEITLSCSRILKDKNLAAHLVNNAYKKVKLFSLDKMAFNTTDFYVDVINKQYS